MNDQADLFEKKLKIHVALYKSQLQKAIRRGMVQEATAVMYDVFEGGMDCKSDIKSLMIRFIVIVLEDCGVRFIPGCVFSTKKILEILRKERVDLLDHARKIAVHMAGAMASCKKDKEACAVINVADAKYGKEVTMEVHPDWAVELEKAIDADDVILACRYVKGPIHILPDVVQRVFPILERKALERTAVAASIIESLKWRISQSGLRGVDSEMFIAGAIYGLIKSPRIEEYPRFRDRKLLVSSIDGHTLQGKIAHGQYCRENNYDQDRLHEIRFFADGALLNERLIDWEDSYEKQAWDFIATETGFKDHADLCQEWDRIKVKVEGYVKKVCGNHKLEIE